MQQALHRPAVRMTADDDVHDSERGYGELDGRASFPTPTFGAFAGMPGEAPHSLKKERDRSTRTLLAFQGE